MLPNATVLAPTLAERIESRVLQATHGRIRNLEVTEIQGRVELRGCVPSHYAKQLALHGALELISGDCFSAQITVDRIERI
ncbi:MAG: BON domain-containing protein [Isosphaeraceae bacterium]|nr:BON domain-containing protein [Isosphaeraceae bacterium]